MSGDNHSRIFDWVRRYKAMTVVFLGLVVAASIFGLKGVTYNNNIEFMLPQDAGVQNTMRFLREANFADKVIISLTLIDEQFSTQDLIHAVDKLAVSIKSPLVKHVISNVSGNDVMSEMVAFLKYIPQLTDAESLSGISGRITPEGIQERLQGIYRQSLAPGSSFMMPFLRSDPLGLSSGLLRSIEKLTAASGYDVVIKDGHLISRDGRHAMVILKTPVVMTDGFGSRKLITYLQGELKKVPDYISADIIAGHMHAVANEDVIKKDIQLTSIVASLAFLLLFLFFLRDIKAVIIFLIPYAAVLIAINITYFVFKNLSYSVIGMGTVIAGIADDYGIYVYMAVRKAGSSLQTVKQVVRPVVFGALTTIGIFAVFFLSSVKGYNQLAFFSNVSIILCLLFSLFILPHFLSKEDARTQSPSAQKRTFFSNFKAPDRVCIIVWVLVMVVMVMSAARLRYSNDIGQFDGAGKNVLSAEKKFNEVWGGKVLPAIFVVSAKTLPEAYQMNADVYDEAVKKIGKDNFTSFVSVWPGLHTRNENAARWRQFWSIEKENEIKKMFSDYGRVYNFSQDAFKPFFDQMQSSEDLSIEPEGFSFFDSLKEQFVVKKEDGYQILSFFPDRDKYLAQLSTITNRYPGSFVVSRKNFSNMVSRALGSELIFLSLLSVFLTCALTFLVLRDIRLAMLALVPVLTGIIMIFGIIPLAGLTLNMSGIISAMVVVGLVSDYGMFKVYYCKYKSQTGTDPAVTLAAVSTVVGAAALLFARHPILYSVGVTLTTGVLAGYVSSFMVIPPLYRLWISEKEVRYEKVSRKGDSR